MASAPPALELSHTLAQAIDIMGAQFGTLQLLHGGSLRLREQVGFRPEFCRFFESVDLESPTTCGRALQGERFIAQDITRSEIYAGRASLEVLLRAGTRSCQSTPILTRQGGLLGVLSTHRALPNRPASRALGALDRHCRKLALQLEEDEDRRATRAIAHPELQVGFAVPSTPTLLRQFSAVRHSFFMTDIELAHAFLDRAERAVDQLVARRCLHHARRAYESK